MLKRISIITTFLFFVLTAMAQKGDPITVSITYKVIYTTNNNQILVDDVCQLDITKSKSFFYSLGKEAQFRSMTEKMKQAKQSGTQPHFEESMFKHNLFQFNTLKDYQNKLVTVIEIVGFQQLGSIKDTLSTNGWKISGEKKVINNLSCRKAQIIKEGNVITAWFCSSIPLHEGPLFYYGLPGLIVESTSTNGWHALLQSFENVKLPNRYLDIRKFDLVSKTQLVKAKKNQKAALEQGILPNGDKIEKVNN